MLTKTKERINLKIINIKLLVVAILAQPNSFNSKISNHKIHLTYKWDSLHRYEMFSLRFSMKHRILDVNYWIITTMSHTHIKQGSVQCSINY